MLFETDSERYMRQSRENADMLNSNLRREQAERERARRLANFNANVKLASGAVVGSVNAWRWGKARHQQAAAAKQAANAEQQVYRQEAPVQATSATTQPEQPTLFDFAEPQAAPTPHVAPGGTGSEVAASVGWDKVLVIAALLLAVSYLLPPIGPVLGLVLGLIVRQRVRAQVLWRRLATAAIIVGALGTGLWVLRTVVDIFAALVSMLIQ